MVCAQVLVWVPRFREVITGLYEPLYVYLCIRGHVICLYSMEIYLSSCLLWPEFSLYSLE